MKRIALLLTGAVMGIGFAHNALPARGPAGANSRLRAAGRRGSDLDWGLPRF